MLFISLFAIIIIINFSSFMRGITLAVFTLMAGTQNGPIPTHLVLLSDLSKLKPDTKVRFLGWYPLFLLSSHLFWTYDSAIDADEIPQSVMEYRIKTANLVLEHNHPPGNLLKAHVDISLLLNSIKSNETRVGEWVNVMGYIKSKREIGADHAMTVEVFIQAIVLWSAGPLDLKGYEMSFTPMNENTHVT